MGGKKNKTTVYFVVRKISAESFLSEVTAVLINSWPYVLFQYTNQSSAYAVVHTVPYECPLLFVKACIPNGKDNLCGL